MRVEVQNRIKRKYPAVQEVAIVGEDGKPPSSAWKGCERRPETLLLCVLQWCCNSLMLSWGQLGGATWAKTFMFILELPCWDTKLCICSTLHFVRLARGGLQFHGLGSEGAGLFQRGYATESRTTGFFQLHNTREPRGKEFKAAQLTKRTRTYQHLNGVPTWADSICARSVRSNPVVKHIQHQPTFSSLAKAFLA